MARRDTRLAILTCVLGLWLHAPLEGQSHRLRPATGLAFVDPVIQRDVDGALNPYVRQCLANLEVVDAAGTKVDLEDLSAAQVRVWPGGRPESSVQPRRVRVSIADVILIDLPPDADVKALVVEVRDLVDASGNDIGTLQSDAIEVPQEALKVCGGEASTRIAVLDRTESNGGGPAMSIDVARRVPFDSRGLWELRLEGAPQMSDESVTLDSWSVDAAVRWNVFLPSSPHWMSFGGTAKLEANESLERIDWVLGVTGKVRLDFIGIDKLLEQIVTRFTPHPMLIVEYDRFVKSIASADGLPVGGGPDPGRHFENRLRGRIDWSVPLLFETTLNAKLHVDYLFGELPVGETEHWKALAELALEYPVNDAGDVVATLTRLDGSTAPFYSDFAAWMIGLAVRR